MSGLHLRRSSGSGTTGPDRLLLAVFHQGKILNIIQAIYSPYLTRWAESKWVPLLHYCTGPASPRFDEIKDSLAGAFKCLLLRVFAGVLTKDSPLLVGDLAELAAKFDETLISELIDLVNLRK